MRPARLPQRRSSYDQAAADFKRFKELRDQGFISAPSSSGATAA
jgi:multidrug resistance efflux pump